MTHEELKQLRKSLHLTQGEMAEKLNGTPVSTYRKWEQGLRKIPPLVEAHFRRSKTDIPTLTMDQARAMAERAAADNISVDELIAKAVQEYLAKFLALALLAVVGYQLGHPSSEQFARKFGRRRDSVDAVEVMGEA